MQIKGRYTGELIMSINRNDQGVYDFKGALLCRAYLKEADLSGADLSGVNLKGADLRKACLIKSNLTKANLTEADLSGANLSGANLYKTSLKDAYLKGVDLSRVDLSRTNLHGIAEYVYRGSKHYLMLVEGFISIGCETHLPSYWINNANRLTITHDYTEEQKREYISQIEHIIKKFQL